MRKFLAFLVRFAGAVFLLIGILLLRATIMENQQEVTGQGDKLILLGTGIVFTLVGAGLFVVSKKMTVKIWQELSRNDKRPPVLYLRSFTKDKDGGKTSLQEWWKKLMYVGSIMPANLTTQEEQLKIAFDDIGPMLAAAKPGMLLHNPGPERIRFEDDWKPKILELMRKAGLILIRAEGNTAYLIWEIEQVFKVKDPRRIIFLLPKSQKAYDQFRFTMQEKVGMQLPQLVIKNSVGDFSGLLYFDSNKRPFIVPIQEKWISAPPGHMFNHISISIKKALNRINPQVYNNYKYEIVSITERTKAFLYDLVIIIPLCLLTATIFKFSLKLNDNDMFGLVVITFMGLQFLYPFFSELYSIKGTFGKRKMGMFVYDKEHLQSTAQQIFMRNFFRVISIFPFVFISLPFAIFTFKSKLPLLHDYGSRTRIFKNVNVKA